MTMSLDPPIRFRGFTVAALAKTVSYEHKVKDGLYLSVSKRPVLLLVMRADEVMAFDLHGNALTPAEVEETCEGAMARFEAFRSGSDAASPD